MMEEPKYQVNDPWSYKPWWCQPWSILLTGITLIAGSWFLWKIWWVTLLVAVPVLMWMGIFLILWPKAYLASLDSQRDIP